MARLARVFGGEERAHHLGRDRWADRAAAEDEHIHRIVLDSLVRRVGVAAVARAHARDLVRGDARADSRAAEQDAAVDLAAHDREAELLGVVRVVDRLGRVCAEVEHAVTERLDLLLHRFLERETRVVAGDGDLHRAPPACVPRTRASDARAASATRSGIKPKCFATSFAGALAPKLVMPTHPPSRPA